WCRRRAEAAWERRTGSTDRLRALPRRFRRPSGGDRGDVLLGLRLEPSLAPGAAKIVVPASVTGDVPGALYLDCHAADGVCGVPRLRGWLCSGLFREAGAELRSQRDD